MYVGEFLTKFSEIIRRSNLEKSFDTSWLWLYLLSIHVVNFVVVKVRCQLVSSFRQRW